jgi:hypothetical protein
LGNIARQAVGILYSSSFSALQFLFQFPGFAARADF